MGKFVDLSEFDAPPPVPTDWETDATQTTTGLEPDGLDVPTAPLSIAEAAKRLGLNADTARKRHLPRILEAVKGTAIEDQVMVVTGTTRAGNPVKRLSPLGFELLADFQSTGGDVDAIESWQRAIAARYALPDPEPIEPEIEPAGVLALSETEIEAIDLATDWLSTTGELVTADWDAIEQSQLKLRDLLDQGGNAIEGALIQIAKQQVAQASHAYQRALNQGLAQVLSGNVATLTSAQSPPKSGASVRSPVG
jgi:hypothetical protein